MRVVGVFFAIISKGHKATMRKAKTRVNLVLKWFCGKMSMASAMEESVATCLPI